MEAELKNKSDNYIQLNDDEDILRLRIKDTKGRDTGEYLEFNLADIELTLKLQQMIEDSKKASEYLKNQYVIIDKKQDHKGKKLLSYKEEEKIKALVSYYKKQEEIYNRFLGENGVKKLLNGRALSWTAFEQIDKIITEQIYPQLEKNAVNIKDRIMKKYSMKQSDTIE